MQLGGSLLQETGQLAGLGRLVEGDGQLVERVGFSGVDVALRGLGGRGEVGRKFSGNLLVLTGIGLLELGQSVHQLSKPREL